MGEIGAPGNAVTIEDTPVNGHTAEGISSNWAFDHDADASAHHAKTALDDAPVDGEVAKGITSNWAYDHKADPIAHHAAVDPGEGALFLLPYTLYSVVAGVFTIAFSSGRLFGQALTSDSQADQDEVTWKGYLAAGTYTIVIGGQEYINSGIHKILVDGVTVMTWDAYAASLENNHREVQTGIVISTSGIKTISLKIDGKNASSGGYTSDTSMIAFYRTA